MVQKPIIYQILRRAGIINTRFEAVRLIQEGAVKANGKTIRRVDYQVDPKKRTITVDGRVISTAAVPKAYFMLNKPEGFITAKKMINGKRHVMELFHEPEQVMNSLFPVGRLDYNTTGLLLVTNDGNFGYQLIGPDSHVEKEYLVEVTPQLTEEKLKKIREGMVIPLKTEKYKTKPAKIVLDRVDRQKGVYRIMLQEGKRRQIRLMMDMLECRVLRLHRIRLGKLQLGDLPLGKYRKVRRDEII